MKAHSFKHEGRMVSVHAKPNTTIWEATVEMPRRPDLAPDDTEYERRVLLLTPDMNEVAVMVGLLLDVPHKDHKRFEELTRAKAELEYIIGSVAQTKPFPHPVFKHAEIGCCIHYGRYEPYLRFSQPHAELETLPVSLGPLTR